MKLLFAIPGFHRYDRGAEVALLSVATELARSGETVTVAGSGAARENLPYEFVHLRSVRREFFERFPKFPPLRSETAWEDATFAAALAAKVPLTQFDATITCSFPFTNWALRRAGTRGPRHIFVTQNGDWPAFSNRSEYRFFSCDGLVCTNPDFYNRNRSRWRSTLIPNGVDLARFRPGTGDRRVFGIPEGVPVVLMVSALIESKRVADGIRAVSKLDNAHLVVAGDGPLREEVRQLADQLLPARYTQLTVAAENMPTLYRCADVFMHLSLQESFGNVFIEALASGLPIVGHDSERLRWIVGSDQLLCDTQDLLSVGNSLMTAFARDKVSVAPSIERFRWSTVAAQYRAFLQEVSS